jgi:transposase
VPTKTAKRSQTRPKREPYTPEPKRARVVALHVAGNSNRQIAVAENLDRGTVGRILSQPEIAHQMEQYRSTLLMMVPKAVRALEAVLESDDERVAAGSRHEVAGGPAGFS